jgi:hypothetical protein
LSGHPVWLHVYDVGPVSGALINSWAKRLLCFGVFHAGIEVFGEEYTFQAMLTHVDGHGKYKTGVVHHEPKQKSQHIYRESISLGQTFMCVKEFEKHIGLLARDWQSRHYNVLRRNCVHFSEQLAKDLQTTEPFPKWVNDLARSLVQNQNAGFLKTPLACCKSSASAGMDKSEECNLQVEDEVSSVIDPPVITPTAAGKNTPGPAEPSVQDEKAPSNNGLLDMRKARLGGC